MSSRRVTARDRHPSTSGFAFEPRALCAMPKVFGRSSAHFSPADGVDSTDPRLRAAQLQHLIANAVREEILALGQNTDQYLGAIDDPLPGLSYDRVIRLLRGKTQMQLADLVFWADRFESIRNVILRELNT
ncbi:hypothetical protein [Orlajensenia leifsoniae]|uniref:Uncharacterized protein n=1 Tax=Orlajensenia leifsoniae TaxID=2561933 RepID=A0A4Y9QUF2_9MICO|nr:hypothetical protein [Leifsonia flava]TFV94853.1 hypothetical protein E4M00_16995 [Leifsonia flava]